MPENAYTNFYGGKKPIFRKTFSPARTDRTEEIRRFAKEKSEQIARYTDNKEVSIAVTSSINNAVEWCVNHPNWKTEMSDEDRMAWIDNVARNFINLFSVGRSDYEELYSSLKNQVDERAEAVAEKINQDVEVSISELIPDDGGIDMEV